MPKEVGWPLLFRWPRPQIPLDWFAGNFQIVEKFKKVLLDMLEGALGKMVVVDEPVELARATGIESDFDGSTAEGGEEGGLEVALEVEDHVEGPIGQLHGHFDESGETCFSLKNKDFIHGRVSLDQGGAGFLKKPGNMGLGTMSFDRSDNGKGVRDIAHGAEENEADPWVGREFHRFGKSWCQREETSFSDHWSEPRRANFSRERRSRFRFALSTAWGD